MTTTPLSALPLTQRWRALWVLCLATLMIVLDTTVVNVALPSIQADLQFSHAGLAWVVNAYLLTFGGFLLLGGRLGDLYGQRPLFLGGLLAFIAASVVCGLAPNQTVLIGARAVQGISGALVDALALALVMNLFTDDKERARAMGVYGFVAAGGGAVGVLAGGVITQYLSWHWVFLVNLPIGVLVLLLALWCLPPQGRLAAKVPLDIGGAATLTGALMLAVYGIVSSQEQGWGSSATVYSLLASVLLLGLFIVIERRVAQALIPFGLLKKRNVATANVVGVLWAAGMFAWFFLAALFLQEVWHFSPLVVGLAFLPANLIMAAFSLLWSAKLVMRFGIRTTVTTGAALMALSLFVFAFAPSQGEALPFFWAYVVPTMLLLGVGCGMMMNPIMLAAMDDLPESDAGLASGMVSTAFMMGGALGLAILASIAAPDKALALTPLVPSVLLENLAQGYRDAFWWAGWAGVVATAVAFVGLKKSVTPAPPV